MFREMRRRRQELPAEKCAEILARRTSGVLAVSGDDGYPYAVPLSYVFCGGKIWFHCAASGHKLDAIRRSDKVSFCVIDRDEIVPREYTTYFCSVIAFGRARVVEEETEKRQALELLAEKYSPAETGRQEEIDKNLSRVRIVELTIEHLSGKEAIELAAARP